MINPGTEGFTKKKDAAPKGVYRHESGAWGIRFTCGAGHLHRERVSTIKVEAVRAHHDRRARAMDEPGWCPAVEREQARAKAQAQITLREYAKDYLTWAEDHKRSWRKDQSRLNRVLPALGDRKLDELTTAEIERFLGTLRQGERPLAHATVNRFRDLLSGMFKRGIRLGLVAANPVKGIPKAREAGQRLVYLPPAGPGRAAHEEEALRDALPPELRPLFAVSVHTGLRWSEQIGLEWRDVDVLANSIGIGRSKNGYSRRVPMNSAVRSVLLDVGAGRQRPNDPTEPVFTVPYRTLARTFARAVERARAALEDAGTDASRLDGYTWHGNRHTFASRLVMAGVDLLTVKELGGWRTLAMVQRYAHLAPAHLASAVERLVAAGLSRDFPGQAAAPSRNGADATKVYDTQRSEG